MNNQMQLKPKHRELVINHLLGGQTLTQAQFCDMTSKASRLAPRILDLRHRGYPIAKEMISLADGTHVARYYLPKGFLDMVNQYGLAFALRAELEKVA